MSCFKMRKAHGRAAALIAGLAVLLVSTGALAQNPAAKSAPIAWNLGNARVVDPGSPVRDANGVLTSGVVVEADAACETPDCQPGTFRIEYSTFVPARDLPGQKAGVTHYTGNWSVGPEAPQGETQGSRLVRRVYHGSLGATAKAGARAFSAVATMPRALVNETWMEGKGRFEGSTGFNGKLSINATILAPKETVRDMQLDFRGMRGVTR